MILFNFPCAYDRIIDPGSALPACMAQSGQPWWAPSGLGQYLPAHSVLYPQLIAPKGLGCCGCNAVPNGLSALTMDGTGLLGTGLFSGGADLSTWGIGEYAVIGLGVLMLYSTFSTTSRGVSQVRRKLRRKKAA